MSKYSEIINALRNCTDSSVRDLLIVSADLQEKTDLLERYGIEFEKQKEGIAIDLSRQPFKIYKTKKSAVSHLKLSDFSSDIIVLEPENLGEDSAEICFEADSIISTRSNFLINVLYSLKFKEFFCEKGISSHDDNLKKTLIFLSSNHGKVRVFYGKNWSPTFYNSNNDLKRQYQNIEARTTLNSDFLDFFRENYIEFAKAIPDENERFTQTLKNIQFIIESADRNYDLFKHNFSFEKFKKDLEEDKEKYLKEYQNNLSDFINKIASMPVQFGVYIYLIVRFSEDLAPITASAILILAWSSFKILSINQIRSNIKFLRDKFSSDFKNMLEKSGIKPKDVENDRRQIINRFDRTLSLTRAYRLFVIIFSICALSFCAFYILKILN